MSRQWEIWKGKKTRLQRPRKREQGREIHERALIVLRNYFTLKEMAIILGYANQGSVATALYRAKARFKIK